jgi:alpha-N-arabinofuranosidase
VSLTNIDPDRPANFEISLPGAAASTARGQVLSAPSVDSVNSFAAPKTVSPKLVSAQVKDGKLAITLAPASVTVLTLDR